METAKAPFLYKETRLNLDPAYPGSTISISLPQHGASSFSLRQQTRRSTVVENPIGQDENEFARRHLASDGSIFFRHKDRYPRSFLWRLLDGRKALEIQSVDLSQSRHDKGEALLTLLLGFPNEIRPFGIAFADPDYRDALSVFVLTTANELYTLTLPTEFFIRPAASELAVGEWCKIHQPTSFSYRSPYRLVATSSYELLVSLHDGGLLRLVRQSKDEGSNWVETYFTEGGWGPSLRGLIPWKGNNTIRYGNLDLDASSAASTVLSPDNNHIFTVCLNHTLKAWDVKTGKVGLQTDLVGENDRDPQSMAQHLISPGQAQLMQVIGAVGPTDESYCVVTYSPKYHRFKFWGITYTTSSALEVRDYHADAEFVPPIDELMNTTIWSLEKFYVKIGSKDNDSATLAWKDSELWIQVRSGPISKCYCLRFDLFETDEPRNMILNAWRTNWTSVDPGGVAVESLRTNPANPGEPDPHDLALNCPSMTERWLDFLFHPGRFTVPVLETSLHVFSRTSRSKPSKKQGELSAAKIPLKERLSAVVASKVPFDTMSDGSLDYDRYEEEMGHQWQAFYGLVRDLQKRRSETLSFAFDPHENLPWLILADFVAPLRICSDMEVASLNSKDLFRQDCDLAEEFLGRSVFNAFYLDVAKAINAGKILRAGFGDTFDNALRTAVKFETLQDPSQSVSLRLQAFEERCNLTAHINDDILTKASDSLEDFGGFQGLENQMIIEGLEDFMRESQRGHHEKQDVTRFGAKTLIRGAQETLETGTEVLLDLLVLFVTMAFEFERSDLAEFFNPDEMFETLMAYLKEHAVLSWLAGTSRQEKPHAKPGVSEASVEVMTLELSQAQLGASAQTMTLLESVFIGDWATMLFPKGPLVSLLTYWCRAWTYGAQLSQQYDAVTAHTLGNLLKHKNYDLAAEFLQFVPLTPWATYLRARLHLAEGNLMMATAYLKKCAYGLSMSHFDVEQNDSAGLLDAEERQYFSNGMFRYYQHVLGLFEKVKSYSHVADFASLALRMFSTDETDDLDSRSDVLSRLFHSSVQTSHFEEAYTALTRYTNSALRKSALATFITSLISSKRIPLLLSFPFTNLSPEVDSALLSLCHKTLNVATGPPHHNILAAFRLSRNDFRGAAAILHDRLERLKTGSSRLKDPRDETLQRAYLTLINVLASVEPDQAWVLAEPPAGNGVLAGIDVAAAKRRVQEGTGGGGGAASARRRVVTLEDIRKEYQAELDRAAAMEHGRFAFGEGDGDEMDVL